MDLQTETGRPAASANLMALRIAALYATISILWILFSDWTIQQLAGESIEDLTWLQNVKGIIYVLAIAGMLFLLIRRSLVAIRSANRALEASQARYRHLIETASEGIWTLDAAGRTTFVNSRMGQMLGCGAGEMIGQPLIDFVKPHERAAAEQILRRQFAESHQCELCFERKDGTDLCGIVSASPIADAGNGDAGLLVMVTDNTQRRQAQQRLAESEQRFRAIFDESGVGIAVYDTAGRIAQANRALCSMLGYTAEELQHRAYGELIHPEEILSSQRDFDELLAGHREHILGEKRYLRKDRQVIWVRRTGTAIRDAEGNVRFVVGMIEDITEARKARDQIEQLNQGLEQRVAQRTAELTQANEQLEVFAYSVSHDLRTPLAAMQAMARELLDKHVAGNEPAEELARRMVASTARMDHNIADLLDYARMGRQQLTAEPVSLIVVVTQVLGQLDEQIKRRGAEVVVHEPLPQVVGHRLTLVQVVTNLISNAVSFVQDGVAPKVRIWAERRDGFLRMWVEDNGVGIAPEDQQRIFRAFERLSEASPGAGLGLALIRHGVQRMGGRVGVESEVGRGSRFWIELPAGRGATPAVIPRR